MSQLIIHHRVQDFARWKPIFDSHRTVRQAAGLKDLHVWQNAADANDVFVLYDVADRAKAEAFAGSADLKQTMQKAGVIAPPDVFFLNEKK